MEIGMYESSGALNAVEAWQKALSHNIAASSVAGFKSTEVAFEGVPTAQVEESPNNGFQRMLIGVTPKAVERISTSRDGPMIQSGIETDIGIQGEGFFRVRTIGGQEIYTRDGQFHFNSENLLVNASGHILEGDGGPISRDPSKGPVRMNEQGQFYQGDTQIGALAAYTFPADAQMLRTEGGLIPADPFMGPESVQNPSFAQGFVEQSNISPVKEMINLITAATFFEANHKVIEEGDNLQGKAIDKLGS